MGLKNYLINDLCASIENVFYYKNSKRIRYDLSLYKKDGEKKILVATTTREVAGLTKCRRIYGYAKTPPTTPVDGESWIIKQGEDEWKDRDDLIAVFLNGEWQFWFWGKEEIFYYLPTQKFSTFNDSLKTIEVADYNKVIDEQWWDSWFSPQVVFGEGTNLYKQIYLYLKQLPGFENVEDC